jgi:hypothetical protein
MFKQECWIGRLEGRDTWEMVQATRTHLTVVPFVVATSYLVRELYLGTECPQTRMQTSLQTGRLEWNLNSAILEFPVSTFMFIFALRPADLGSALIGTVCLFPTPTQLPSMSATTEILPIPST